MCPFGHCFTGVCGTWTRCEEYGECGWKGRTSSVKIPPRKTRHVRFGAASAVSEGPEEDETSVDTADHPVMEQLPQELFGCNFGELAAIDENLSTCDNEVRDWEKDASTLLGELQDTDKDEGECSRPEHTGERDALWDAETLWYLTMFLCCCGTSLCSCQLSCVPVLFQICLCVSLRDLLAIYKTREHRILTSLEEELLSQGSNLHMPRLCVVDLLRNNFVRHQAYYANGEGLYADPETGLLQEEEPDFVGRAV
ncbi:hypothetical protein Bbelb_326610 [Branchiostoma belcheri]|nr:hypothetical protein Bbelb_326610 [Branchiostoma belcheri]